MESLSVQPLWGARLRPAEPASGRPAAPALAQGEQDRFDPAGSASALAFAPASGSRVSLPAEASNAAFSLVPGPVGAVCRSLWEAVDYELRKLPQGAGLADRLSDTARQTAVTVALVAAGGAPSPVALLSHLDRRLLEELPEGFHRASYRSASDSARRYLGLKDHPVSQPHASPVPDPTAPPEVPGYPPEVASVAMDRVSFPGVSNYVESRLGPVAHLLDGLGARDRVRFTNQPVSRSLSGLPPVRVSEHLNLPISSWNKTVELLSHEDGTRTLLFADFPGKGLMRHFQLLARHRLEGRPDAPTASMVEDPKGYEATYDAMARLFRARPDALGDVEAVVVGYEGAFRKAWRGERTAVLHESSPWKAETWRLPNGKKVAVLSTDSSFHGEILGQNLRRVVQENPRIRQVYAAGSGGSLHAREPYTVVFPDRIEGRDGVAVPNALGSGTGVGVHRSTLSVMAETPELIRQARADQVTTLDMEMGPLAEALAGTGVELGVAMLVTDFPAGASLSGPVELARQDTSRKYLRISDYPAAVRDHLEQGKPAWAHPLEAHLGCSLDELSARNLAREKEHLGAMTPEETRLFERVRGVEPSYSFRMTGSRLRRVLEDGVILSTAQVSTLKGAPVKPYTPQVEEDLYGAFDYTFGAVGVGRGNDEYGEVRVVLRPETVQARSHATYRSGWRALVSAQKEQPGSHLDFDSASPGLMEAARRRFADWVVTPEHYRESMALFAVEEARREPEVMRDLLAASDAELPATMARHGLGYLEGRIRGSLNLEDVAYLEIPKGAPEDLVQRARQRGLQVRR